VLGCYYVVNFVNIVLFYRHCPSLLTITIMENGLHQSWIF